MARNPYFDILFEPVRIGPVTTKNRFYQVPHPTAHGYKMPNAHAGVLYTLILFKVGLLINLISKRSGDGMRQQPDEPKRLVLISFMSMQRMTF